MYAFEYVKPKDLDDAVALLKNHEEAQPVSGGQTLIPTLKQRLAAPTQLVDLKHVHGLSGVTHDNHHICVGATTRHVDVEQSDILHHHIPAVAELAGQIGDPQVRRRGTIGGSLANNDPSACYPSAAMALNARIHTNSRMLMAEDFFTGLFMTALEEGEVITRVDFKIPARAKYMKFPNPASRYAMTGVFVAQFHDEDGVRVAITGASEDGVMRHHGLEAALNANFHADAVDAVAISADGLMSDLHGSAAYRANLIKVMTKRAVSAIQ